MEMIRRYGGLKGAGIVLVPHGPLKNKMDISRWMPHDDNGKKTFPYVSIFLWDYLT